MVQPIYRIPAREVVPGMLLPAAFTKWDNWPIADVHQVDGVVMLGVQVGDETRLREYGFRDEQPIPVLLPGPSPRELLCTCLIMSQRNPDPAPVLVLPSWHDPSCPVAPNLDPERGPAHGGLRLWPVGGAWVGGTWAVRRRLGVIGGGTAWLDAYRTKSPAVRDMVLEAFFHPPIVPDLPTTLEQWPTPWDPEDVHEVLG